MGRGTSGRGDRSAPGHSSRDAWFFHTQKHEKGEELATVSNLQPLTPVQDIYMAIQQADIEVDALITVGREIIWISRYK
jgi:hypothetical protein